ncbi:MAG: hypothetical protein U9R43_14535 [Thermodesulfobacteriota bacterium]|nr:hypothetical protein [Thermodesulfobacteriota bacterium]
MRINALHTLYQRVVYLAIIAAIGLTVIFLFTGADQPSRSNHNVYIAFGFHVNLYHSFRNDTNDDSGFGKDIRIIRHIIRTLDNCNANGTPVKGVWDFDNLFSLQEILPRYAPDIIEDIRRRVHVNGDEVILMSYNNGMVSAMTQQELNDAVRWSITNPWQSGVQDMFGKYTPIVRPQEMMTTAGNFSIYKEHGIQAVSLYYSSTPFDTFRVFSRPLTRAEAHNPLLYRHPQTKEEMIIIPTYHFGDLAEHVSLKHWVGELRDMQIKGKLNQDALLFINYDADSELWGGLDLPWIVDWLPNTGGINALVNEVKDIPNVKFTTLGNYLARHPPVGTFSFSQDTADGSFNGYNSWAEKADASRYWTTIECSRRTCTAARKAMALLKNSVNTTKLQNLITFADQKRLRALSTTNFGMATPFLARQRELVMDDIVNALANYSDEVELLLAEGLSEYLERNAIHLNESDSLHLLDTVLVLQSDRKGKPDGSRFISVPVPNGYTQGSHLLFITPEGDIHPTASLGIHPHRSEPMLNLYVTGKDELRDGIYHLCAVTNPTADKGRIRLDHTVMLNGRLSVRFEKGQLEGIYLEGSRKTDSGGLLPHLKWDGQSFQARAKVIVNQPVTDGQSASFRVAGPLPGPSGRTLSEGWMDYTFTMVSDLPYLLVQAKIRYPSTIKDDIIKVAAPGLIRRVDMKWDEVAPAEIRFFPTATQNDPIRILKENYLGVSTEYALDYFHHSDINLNLDNVNNHITGSYVGLAAGNSGMAIAMDNSVQSNFAFAPVRLQYDRRSASFSASVNPFGTYHGNQYSPPTWGNGNGFDATLLAGEQFASAGPTYNGVEQTFSLMLAFFNNRNIPETIRRDLVDFANPPMVVSSSRKFKGSPPGQPLAYPQGFVAAFEQGLVRFCWDNGHDPDGHYMVYCGTAAGRYEAVYPAIGNSLKVSQYTDGQPFKRGRKYFATIEKISANEAVSERAEEIQFAFEPVKEARSDIPLKLELKVLWANVHALLNDWRM